MLQVPPGARAHRPTSKSSPCAVQGPQTPAQTPLQSDQAVCTAFGSRMPHLPRVENLLRLVARQQLAHGPGAAATAVGGRYNASKFVQRSGELSRLPGAANPPTRAPSERATLAARCKALGEMLFAFTALPSLAGLPTTPPWAW